MTRSRSLRFTHTAFLTPRINVSGGCHASARRHHLTVQAWPCWGGDATPAPQLAKHHTHAFSHFESSSHANSRNSPASPIRSLRSRGPFTCCECRRHSINGSVSAPALPRTVQSRKSTTQTRRSVPPGCRGCAYISNVSSSPPLSPTRSRPYSLLRDHRPS